MVENIKPINNPLTIIAIFAALAEIAGTVALKLVAENLQYQFIWFVMLFPALLVCLFFYTLHKKHEVLYAPSDYKDEENFLRAGGKVIEQITDDLIKIKKELESAKTSILSDAVTELQIASESEKEKLTNIIQTQLEQIRQNIISTKEQVKTTELGKLRISSDENAILQLLRNSNDGLDTRQIMEKLSITSPFYAADILRGLVEKNLVTSSPKGKLAVYKLRNDASF